MTPPSVGGHLNAAAGHAARLIASGDSGPATPHVLTLRDDARDALAGLLLATAGPPTVRPNRIADIGRHPVEAMQALLDRLLPLGAQPGNRPAPSERWAASAAPGTSHADWRGLAVHTVLAADILQRNRPALTTPAGLDAARWTAVRDSAVLVEAFTIADQCLVSRIPQTVERRGIREQQAALALAAREAAALASGARVEDLIRLTPHSHQRPIACSRVEAIGAATSRLAVLVNNAAARGTLDVPNVMAAANALARVSRSAAAVLTAAANSADPGMVDVLAATSDAVARHGEHLARAVRDCLARTASLKVGDHVVRTQAAELSGELCRRLDALIARPQDALRLSPTLHHYPAAANSATRALIRAVATLDRSRELLVRDRADNAVFSWVPSRQVGGPATLLGELRQGQLAIADATRAPNFWMSSAPSVDPVAALRFTLTHRRREARPVRPGLVTANRQGQRVRR